MKKTKPSEEIVIEKPTTVAYCSYRKLTAIPFLKPNGRVAHKVQGNVSEVLGELQSNPLVPLLDYLNRLDAVRSTIFTLKAGGKS